MADNTTYTPGSGATIAADDVDGALYQRVKPTIGKDGSATDISESNPLPVVNLDLTIKRLIKSVESLSTVDAQQRQRIAIDSITGGLTLATVTTVGTVSSVTNQTQVAGMDRELYINISRQTYATCIRARLT